MQIHRILGPGGIGNTKTHSRVNIPNGSKYPPDKRKMMTMPNFSELAYSRLNNNIKLPVENISSGFGSGQDGTSPEVEGVHAKNKASSSLQNVNQTINGFVKMPNMVFNVNSISLPSNFSPIQQMENTDINFNNSMDLKLSNSSMWDIDPNFTLKDTDISNQINGNSVLNFDEFLNVTNIIPHNDTLFQTSMFDEKMDASAFEKINFMEPNMPVQNMPNNILINTEIQDPNFLMENSDQITNQMILQMMDTGYINDPNFNAFPGIPNHFDPNFVQTNVNNPNNNQNVIVRVLQNGQLHFASIDQNVLQQMLMNNQTQNINLVPTQALNNSQIQGLVNGVDNSVQTNMNESVIQKTDEPVDLMENPANWRRLPNNGGYQCNLCNKCYTRKYGLKIHLRIHSGFKPLECKVCKKKFGDPSNMAKHIRLHSSEGSPYKCNLCDKPLVRRRDLERHMRSRHPDCMGRPHIDTNPRV